MATKSIQTRIRSADERFHQRLPRVLPMLPRLRPPRPERIPHPRPRRV